MKDNKGILKPNRLKLDSLQLPHETTPIVIVVEKY